MHNYIDFIRMLVAVFVTFLLQLVLCSYTLALLNRNVDTEAFEIGLMSKESLIALNWTTLAVSIILILLDSYLLIFHIYLMCKNLSTYKHIRSQ